MSQNKKIITDPIILDGIWCDLSVFPNKGDSEIVVKLFVNVTAVRDMRLTDISQYDIKYISCGQFVSNFDDMEIEVEPSNLLSHPGILFTQVQKNTDIPIRSTLRDLGCSIFQAGSMFNQMKLYQNIPTLDINRSGFYFGLIKKNKEGK